MPALSRPIAIALILAALTGCQAPGFMGLSSSTTPDATQAGSQLVRARFRVLIPASLAQGVTTAPPSSTDAATSPGQAGALAVVGAKVYLEGQTTTYDFTDDQGFASLGLVQGQLTPIRAEFKTADGSVIGMSALAYVGDNVQSVPIFPISLSTTLVTSKIAQKFPYSDLKYLNFTSIQKAESQVDQALRTPDGAYDPQYLPDLSRQWSVMDLDQALIRLDPILSRALASVLATPIPDDSSMAASRSLSATDSLPLLDATLSTTLSATPSLSATSSATASLVATPDATVSVKILSGDDSLFAGEVGSKWVYDLFDSEGKPHGQVVRQVTKASLKGQGEFLMGTETGAWDGHDRQMIFLMKRSPSLIRFAAAYRPSVDYPLPLKDGQSWAAAPGIRAIAHAPTEASGSWRIDFSRIKDGTKQDWSEWLAAGKGFTRLQWYDPHGHRWEARLHSASSTLR